MTTVWLGVGDVARKLGVRPSLISQLFYERKFRDDLCPIISGRRMIPETYVEIIAMELHYKGIKTADPLRRTAARPTTPRQGHGLTHE